jgi:hypothetical protein
LNYLNTAATAAAANSMSPEIYDDQSYDLEYYKELLAFYNNSNLYQFTQLNQNTLLSSMYGPAKSQQQIQVQDNIKNSSSKNLPSYFKSEFYHNIFN